MVNKWPYPLYREYQKGLRAAAGAWFKENSVPVRSDCNYRLKKENWTQNLIPENEVDILNYLKEREVRPIHTWIQHGLSSQAMLFNLVGPLLCREDLDPLKRALLRKRIPWPSKPSKGELEYEDRQVFGETDNIQPTSIDLVVRPEDNSNTNWLIVEAKLSETEFGGCTVFEKGNCDGRNPRRHDEDTCYYDYVGKKYWDCAQDLLSTEAAEGLFCPFMSHFQFFREVMFAQHFDGDYVLLYDENNPTFVLPRSDDRRGLFPFLYSLLSSEAQSCVHRIAIQDVLDELLEDTDHASWAREFAKKYGMTEMHNQ